MYQGNYIGYTLVTYMLPMAILYNKLMVVFQKLLYVVEEFVCNIIWDFYYQLTL